MRLLTRDEVKKAQVIKENQGLARLSLVNEELVRKENILNQVVDNVDADKEKVLRDFTQRYFPQAAGPTLGLKTCLFTNSPDGHFILDILPGLPQVSVAAGFSGHGFKYCSVVGEIMADLAQHGDTPHDLSMFRLARFQ